MNQYVATFFTHFSAMKTLRALDAAGAKANAAPVPRQLSASCGTCVFYQAQNPMADCLHRDYECVYQVLDGYKAVLTNDVPV